MDIEGVFDIKGDRPAARIQKALYKEAENRKDRHYSEWIPAELAVMHNVTNLERAKLGKKPIGIEKIEAVESMARGHIDYSLKFALYCEDLVNEE